MTDQNPVVSLPSNSGPVRDFDQEYAQKNAKPGLTFRLFGREWHTKGVAPPAAFMNYGGGVTAAVHFIHNVLVKDERDAFMELVSDPDIEASGHQLDQIASWLISETSGKDRTR